MDSFLCHLDEIYLSRFTSTPTLPLGGSQILILSAPSTGFTYVLVYAIRASWDALSLRAAAAGRGCCISARPAGRRSPAVLRFNLYIQKILNFATEYMRQVTTFSCMPDTRYCLSRFRQNIILVYLVLS